MSQRGGRPPSKNWAAGLRPMTKDQLSSRPPPSEIPKGVTPSEEKEFRFLMGQSFMGGGLDGLVGGGAGPGGFEQSQAGQRKEDLPQEAVDDMLSTILQKAQTDLLHVNPALVEPPPLPPPTPNQGTPSPSYPTNSPYLDGFFYPGGSGYPVAPGFPSTSFSAHPPLPAAHSYPNFDQFGLQFQNPPSTSAPLTLQSPSPEFDIGMYSVPAASPPTETEDKVDSPPKDGEKKIQRKWSNILKPPEEEKSASASSVSPKVLSSPSPARNPWERESKGELERHSASPARELAGESASFSEVASDCMIGASSSESFKNIMEYDIDPLEMTPSGKEFVDVVEGRSSKYPFERTNRVLCHLCRERRLPSNALTRHLDGDNHRKNLRDYVLAREYDLYEKKSIDPLYSAKYPDFTTYLLRKYPERTEEFFLKTQYIDDSSRFVRNRFVLKHPPVKLKLKEKGSSKESKTETESKKKNKLESTPWKCLICLEEMSARDGVKHSCQKKKAEEAVPSSGVPRFKPRRVVPEQFADFESVIPPDAVDVRPKTEMCQEFARFSICQYGKKCIFAHRETELHTLTYRRIKSELCKIEGCVAVGCGRAHGEDELEVIKYKTQLCRGFVEFETCQYGNKCHFAHGVKEMLSPFDSLPIGRKAAEATTSTTKTTSMLETRIISPKLTDESPSCKKPKIKLTLKTSFN